MAQKNEDKWTTNYEALKVYIAEHGHLPDKHKIESRALLSWSKYQKRKIKEGTLDDEKRVMFEALLATRSNEHTGGRKKKCIDPKNEKMPDMVQDPLPSKLS